MARTALFAAGFAVAVALAQASGQASDAELPDRYLSPRTSKCFLSRQNGFVERLLATLAGSNGERAVLERSRIEIDSCFGINSDGSRFRSSYDFGRMRAGIVRALLLSRRDLLTVQAPPRLANHTWYMSGQPGEVLPEPELVLANDIGFCLARKNWGGVRAIVLATDPKFEGRDPLPKGVREHEARAVEGELKRMVSLLPSCVPAGLKIRLSRVRLRSLLEETALHAVGGGASAEARNYPGDRA